MNKTPLKVGVTGGLGSGKSTVCRVFALLKVPVYSADNRAKWLMANSPELKIQITDAFGSEAYLADGTVNRSFLANQVFQNPEKTTQINSLVHPAVGKDFDQWVSSQMSPYVIKEAALLFETGSAEALDYVVNVSSPLKIRMARVLMRDPHRTEQQINQIINQQLPDEQKNEMADFVIKNTENRLIIPQILEIHQKLLSKAQ